MSLCAMFGGEAMKRKYGMTPPKEWVEVIGRLRDYELARGMRRVLGSGTEHIPSLPKFRRFCQEVATDDDPPQTQPLMALPSNLANQDDWEVLANRRLLKHIYTVLGKDPKALGPVTPYDFKLHRDEGKPNLGSQQQQNNTAVLVHWKKKWAQDMRDEATAEGVDGKYQREVWDAHMRMAHQEFV